MAYRKGLVLSFGLVNVIVSIDGAVQKEDSLATVCTGTPGTPAHAPTKIAQQRHCATCGEVQFADLKKARVVGDSFQVIEQQEVAAVRDQALGASKKMLTLTAHDAAEVNANTLQGESVYYMSPDGAAQVGAYSLLLDAVTRRNDIAFVTTYTPTSRQSMWQLKAFQGTLVVEQRVWPEQVRPAPATGALEPDSVLSAQLDQIISAMVVPFEASNYQDTYNAALNAALAAKELETGIVPEQVKGTPVTAAPVVDLSSALAAMLGNVTATA